MDDAERKARLEAWFRSYADRVRAYLLHRTDPETAQDVLQEVFMTALRKMDAVPDPPIGWLFGTARRTLANSSRATRRRDRLALRIAGATDTADQQSDSDEIVVAALAQLSAADREVLTLSAWYDLTADEAAQALGCSSGTYGVRLFRARRRLADRLEAAGHPLAKAPAQP